jgi:hypothetical protein
MLLWGSPSSNCHGRANQLEFTAAEAFAQVKSKSTPPHSPPKVVFMRDKDTERRTGLSMSLLRFLSTEGQNAVASESGGPTHSSVKTRTPIRKSP